jgi:hypothetical protein
MDGIFTKGRAKEDDLAFLVPARKARAKKAAEGRRVKEGARARSMHTSRAHARRRVLATTEPSSPPAAIAPPPAIDLVLEAFLRECPPPRRVPDPAPTFGERVTSGLATAGLAALGAVLGAFSVDR